MKLQVERLEDRLTPDDAPMRVRLPGLFPGNLVGETLPMPYIDGRELLPPPLGMIENLFDSIRGYGYFTDNEAMAITHAYATMLGWVTPLPTPGMTERPPPAGPRIVIPNLPMLPPSENLPPELPPLEIIPPIRSE